MMFSQVVEVLQRYFAEHNIDTYGFTLILNFQDFQSAAKLDFAFAREFESMMQTAQQFDSVNFKIRGMEIRLESPVHVRLLK